MAKKIPSNKLSIYLVKKDYSAHEDIVKNIQTLNAEDLNGVGTFYYGDSFEFTPSWVKKFFGMAISNSARIFSASAKGLLLVEITKDAEKRIFAIAFGYGWQSLKPGVIEERFGLKTALGIIDPDNLRKIDKKNMVTVPKDTSEQLSKAGIASDFGIDIEQDLIRSVTGKSIDEKKYGKYITGKDSLSISVRVNISSIKDFLKICYERYLSDDYKKYFDWIDQIAEIKDIKLIEELNNKLIENLKNSPFNKTWMAVPDVVEWEHVSGFRYSHKKEEELKDDIDVSSFMNFLSDDEKQNLTLGLLKNKIVYCISSQNDEIKHHWNAFSCLYCEEHDNVKNKTFILSNGKWYEIESDFSQQVNADFQSLRTSGSTVTLPSYNHDNENEYNKAAAISDGNLCCMDCNCITIDKTHSKIEFCDLMTKDKKFIHIKRYGGSSVLSHLFSQGLVSGELFLRDTKFREKVNEKLPDSFKISNVKAKPIASQHEVVYGIISSCSEDLDIPFFSKVSLRTAKNRLETFGYKVSLLKISTNGN